MSASQLQKGIVPSFLSFVNLLLQAAASAFASLHANALSKQCPLSLFIPILISVSALRFGLPER